MKKIVSLLIALTLLVSSFALTAVVAFADEPAVTCDATQFENIVLAENSDTYVEMDKDFMLPGEWLKDSAKVALVFPGINYKVEGDDGYDKNASYDKIYLEYSSSTSLEGETWDSCLVTSDFSLRTSGWWVFRYMVKRGNDVVCRSQKFQRYATDTSNPIVALSEAQKNKQASGLTEGVTYTISTSLDINDASSTTVSYVVYKMVAGAWTQIYDSTSKEVVKGYESVISTSGVITPSAEDISANKDYVYKVVYSVVDANGYYGVAESDKTKESNPELLLFVSADPKNVETGKNIETWKLILYIVAGLSFVGIIVLLCIKPSKPAVAEGGRVHYATEEHDEPNE